MRILAIVGLALALPAAFTAAGMAATPADLVDDGVALRAEGRDADALERFLAAYAQDPAPRTAAQVGLAQQALGRWVEAERFLAEALKDRRDAWIRKHRRTLDTALDRIREQLGDLRVEGTPVGAQVRFGGRLVGTLPMTEPARVVAQRALLEVSAAGYADVAREVTVAPKGRSFERVALTPAAAGEPLDAFDRARRDALVSEGVVAVDDSAELARLSAIREPLRPVFGLTAGVMVPGKSLAGVEYAAAGGFEPGYTSVFDDENPSPLLLLTGGFRATLGDDLDLVALLSFGWFVGQRDDYNNDDADVTALVAEADVGLHLRPTSAVSGWYLQANALLGVAAIFGDVDVLHTGAQRVVHDISDTTASLGLGVGTGFLLGSREQWDLALLIPLRFSVGGGEGGFGDAISVGVVLRAAYAL